MRSTEPKGIFMGVEKKTREVYYSPRRGRHFMTKIGAARAEANARMYRAFPSEEPEYEDYGRCTYPGWDFTKEPRLVAVRDRLVDRYLRQLSGGEA